VKLRVLALASLFALSACGTLGGGRDDKGPEAPDPSAFTADVGFAQAWSYELDALPASGGFALVPAVAEGRVYVANAEGRVAALDAESGRPLWQVELKRQLSGGPAVSNGLLAVGGRDGALFALSTEDGRTLWSAKLTSEVLAPPRVGAEVVVARTVDGRVFGLDARTGERRWLFERTLPVLTLRGLSAPLLVPGRLVAVGLDTGKLVGLAPADGKLLWETTVAVPQGRSDLERMVDIDADPLLYRGDIYVASYQGRLAAIEPASGRIKWEREVSAHAGLAADTSRIYVSDAAQRLAAFDRFTGAAVWRNDEVQGLRLTGPAQVGDYVIVGDNEGYLNWFSAQEGKLLRRQEIGGAFVAAPVVEGDSIYLLTADGLTVLR
jgi:outer membrane protein assembly factor BamB